MRDLVAPSSQGVSKLSQGRLTLPLSDLPPGFIPYSITSSFPTRPDVLPPVDVAPGQCDVRKPSALRQGGVAGFPAANHPSASEEEMPGPPEPLSTPAAVDDRPFSASPHSDEEIANSSFGRQAQDDLSPSKISTIRIMDKSAALLRGNICL